MKKQVTVINQEKNVCCLPGFESMDTASMSKRMPKRKVKSIKELEYDKEKRQRKHVSITS